MSKEIQPGRALYYPNFTPDSNWLKCSLLYWDQVYRIVPDEAKKDRSFKDSSDCNIAEAEGLLETKDPGLYKQGAGVQFIHKLQPILTSKDRRHRKWLARVKKELTTPIHRGKTPNWLHDAKVPHEIKFDLEKEGLLKADGDWLKMPNIVAGLYMTCLATEMSSRIRTHLLTDQSVLSAGAEGIMFGNSPIEAERDLADEQLLLLRLGVRFPKPEALHAVSMKKLVKFHQQNRKHRRSFREAFDTVLHKAKESEDPNHLEGVLNDERANIAEVMKMHRTDMKELGVTGLWSFLKISVPSMMAAKWLENFAFTPALAVAGVAIGAAAALIDIRKQRAKQLSESPWHYAWKVQKRFS